MKRTTLALDERVLQKIKSRAREEGKTFQEVANELLRLGLESQSRTAEDPTPFPVYALGQARVDVADRQALLDALDGDEA
ncbi:MAG: hypothetical protein JXR96_19085 [Deltaproteobacteria bacterium]|nr:hypothetical protein [Deltaproteobacteria bacterium]